MQLFKNTSGKLTYIHENSFDLEKDLQKLTEENLELIFGLKFIATEFSLHEFRIDTLAYDEENKSFVIIEYKKGSSLSVIDQGYTYLGLMLDNQAHFVLEYNQKSGKNYSVRDFNREGSRVMFVANGFTAYQRNAINFKDLPIELWEAKKIGTDIVIYDQIRAKNTQASVKTITKNTTMEKVVKELKTYTVDDQFRSNWQESREMYEELRDKLLALDPRIEENPKKIYIGYKIGNSNVFELWIQKSAIHIHLLRVQAKDLQDPEKRVEDVQNSMKYFNKYISNVKIESPDQIDYGVFLAKQVLKKFFSN